MILGPEVLGDFNGILRFTPLNGCTKPAIISGSTIEIPQYRQLDFQVPKPRGLGTQIIPGLVVLIENPSSVNCQLAIVERHPLYPLDTLKLGRIRVLNLLSQGSEPNIFNKPGPFQRERWTQTIKLKGIAFSDATTAISSLESAESNKMLEEAGISPIRDFYKGSIMLLLKGCEAVKTQQPRRRTSFRKQL